MYLECIWSDVSGMYMECIRGVLRRFWLWDSCPPFPVGRMTPVQTHTNFCTIFNLMYNTKPKKNFAKKNCTIFNLMYNIQSYVHTKPKKILRKNFIVHTQFLYTLNFMYISNLKNFAKKIFMVYEVFFKKAYYTIIDFHVYYSRYYS